MTEYELMDVAGTYHGLGVSSLMGYFTVFVSFLVAAYVVGPKMTRQQVIVVTGLFLVMQFFMIWGTAGFFYYARGYVDQAIDNNVMGIFKPHHLALPLLIFGVFAGLKFMWDVRHPKT